MAQHRRRIPLGDSELEGDWMVTDARKALSYLKLEGDRDWVRRGNGSHG